MANKPTLTAKLSELRRQEEEARTKDLANKLGLPYVSLFGVPIEADALKVIPEEEARKGNLIVVHKTGKSLEIAVGDPENIFTKKALENLGKQNFQYSLLLASKSGLKESFERYKQISLTKEVHGGQIDISSSLITNLREKIKDLGALKAEIKQIPGAKTSELLETIISGALSLDASDVHLEPKGDETLLKYRLDGMLHEVVFLSSKAYQLILSRIKLLSGIKLNIKDVGQDGRFSIQLKEADIEIRSSIIPGSYGESIVLRILNPKMIGLNLEDLGFRKEDLAILEKEIKRPNGLIITTGPTGSGKTTTLYAFIKKILRPEVKIVTLEDPVEYHLLGITQTQVEPDAGYDFSGGLRSILRQDPDIILVGEIRDTETAKTALNASLTGHLVFSTLHTNDAAGAIPRFIDLGANPGSLASSLNLLMAQRLVRRVCEACKNPYKPTKEEVEKITAVLKGVKHIPLEKASFVKAAGCENCNGLGYKGRIGVLEIIKVDDDIEKLISKSPSHADVLEIAEKKGMITMHQDALLKVLTGITTLEEVERVID